MASTGETAMPFSPAVRKHLPADVRYHGIPAEGMFLWFEMPAGFDAGPHGGGRTAWILAFFWSPGSATFDDSEA